MADTGFTRLAGVVLAGGQGSRMGGQDKGLVPFRHAPMISWTLQQVRPAVDHLMISCNRNMHLYSRFGETLVSDHEVGYCGPLAGIQAALAELDTDFSHLLVLPCDTPLLSLQVIDQLVDSARQYPDHIVFLKTGDREHYLHAVIPVCYQTALKQWLAAGQGAVGRWYRQFPHYVLDASRDGDCLLNMNTPELLAVGA
ncbi:molybdenum cofactor guanylyltransferase MobA [Amphritea japonica]|uniref:Molybdenum cofactor guanylyltransferase n=1 Tax=Amphritea japonica ATCC BAA-1530 TaxID=1278309 RepID=A0A7R6STV4_9GAMM|nr:molybdenum cofactor guanylyltransferase MobA [Amphritea japonica]BBB27047.1 molybdopterin-guanine dinucleotide biosynthesis protein A [Amphritea japonica ATCC BAA-1530]